VASLGSIYPKDTEAPPSGVDDMTKLAYLHEPGVLHNLSCRYGLNEIYVSTCRPETFVAIFFFFLSREHCVPGFQRADNVKQPDRPTPGTS